MLLAGGQQADILVLLAIQKGGQVLEMCVHATRKGEVVFQEQGRLLARLHKHSQAIHMILGGSLGRIRGGFAQLMNHTIQWGPHTSQFGHGFLLTILAGFQIHDLDDVHVGPRRIAFKDRMFDQRDLPRMPKDLILGREGVDTMQKVTLYNHELT